MMDEIRYHPLVDADTDGTEKVPMFCTTARENMDRHRFFLEEIIPHNFRLCSTASVDAQTADSFSIRCPYCGKTMRQISNQKSGTRHALYACPRCS